MQIQDSLNAQDCQAMQAGTPQQASHKPGTEQSGSRQQQVFTMKKQAQNIAVSNVMKTISGMARNVSTRAMQILAMANQIQTGIAYQKD